MSRVSERLLEAVLPGEDAGACNEYMRCRCVNTVCYWYACYACAGQTNCTYTGRRC